MKNQKLFKVFVFGIVFCGVGLAASAQTAGLLKRTTYKADSADFGVGGTLSIVGAPNGSIEVEGWNKPEIEISAVIEVQAGSEEDLAKLAGISGFMLDAGVVKTRIISLGAYDKKYLKSLDVKIPKSLRAMPLRIDYKIKVPLYCDLEIAGGTGDLKVSRVEGALRITFLETNAKLDLVGGTVSAAFGGGTVDVVIPSASWRGRNVDVQLITGSMSVGLSRNLNADLDAKVLRTGQIENSLKYLKKRDRTEFTENLILAKAGSGGASFSFTVGDGTLKLSGIEKPL